MEIDILAAAISALDVRRKTRVRKIWKGARSGKWVESVMQIERAPLAEHYLFRMQCTSGRLH